MMIDFACVKCEASFELDSTDMIEGAAKLVCPNCSAKIPTALMDDFVAALSEMKAQVAALSKKFTVNMAIESEDLDLEDEDEEEDSSDDDALSFEGDDTEEDEEEDVEDEDLER